MRWKREIISLICSRKSGSTIRGRPSFQATKTGLFRIKADESSPCRIFFEWNNSLILLVCDSWYAIRISLVLCPVTVRCDLRSFQFLVSRILGRLLHSFAWPTLWVHTVFYFHPSPFDYSQRWYYKLNFQPNYLSIAITFFYHDFYTTLK